MFNNQNDYKMKKLLSIFPKMAMTILTSTLCSCGNSGKSQMDEQALKDSIENVVMDSIRNAEAEKAKRDSIETFNKTHSPEVVLKRVKEMLGKDAFFSKDYNSICKKLQEAGDKYWPGDIVGPDYVVWDSSQGGCGEGRTKFGDVQNITEKTATMKVYNKFECDENHDIVLHLVFENGDWFVDDISNCFTKSIKNDMKKELEDMVK